MRLGPLWLTLCLLLSSAFAGERGQSASQSASLKKGREVYEQNCVACHGLAGRGDGPAAAAIPGAKPRDFTRGLFKFGRGPEELFGTITRGIDGSAMPSWASLPEEERRAVVRYVLEFSRKKSVRTRPR